jgi:hypothetical protein
MAERRNRVKRFSAFCRPEKGWEEAPGRAPARFAQIFSQFDLLWPRSGPVLGPTLACLWGPEASQRGPGDFQETTLRRPKPFPWSAFGLPLGAGPPEGGRGLQGDNPGDPKWASRRRGAQVLEKHTKTMSISLRRNVHAV